MDNRTEEKYNIYVIVVTFNGLHWIDRCLTSILNSEEPLNIIVVDNNSTDGTFEWIKDNYQNVLLIKCEKNIGFGQANNKGIQYALDNKCDFVYLLNQDAWIKPDTIGILLKMQSKYHQYGVLSPMQLNAKESDLDKGFSSVCFDQKIVSDFYMKKVKEVYDVEFVMAAHWLITKECLKEVGAFSPLFYHYGEDNNYLDRVIYHGYKIGISTICYGIHDREYRELTPEKSIYLLYASEFLSIVSNINKSMLRCLLRGYFILFYRTFLNIGKYNTLTPLQYLIKGFWVLPKIIKTRKRTKNKSYLLK